MTESRGRAWRVLRETTTDSLLSKLQPSTALLYQNTEMKKYIYLLTQY